MSSVALGPSSGPVVEVFKRTWSFINKGDFRPASDELFIEMSNGFRQEMIVFFTDAIKKRSPREDDRELLQLCHVFLGGSSDEKRVPINDFNLLTLLHKYPVPDIRDATVKAFRRHLW